MNEGVRVTLTASPAYLTGDDIAVYDESGLLSLTCTGISPNEADDTTVFNFEGVGITPGITKMIFIPMYDYVTATEETDYQVLYFPITVLDAEDSRIVYVSQTGDKYHYSMNHAGDYPMETTIFDALNYEYEPCGVCIH